MKQHDATEQAFKNGYKAGKRDAMKNRQISTSGCFALIGMAAAIFMAGVLFGYLLFQMSIF